MPLVGGLFVKDADDLIIEELKRRGVLWKAGRITHQYPHCWRCGTPLIYYARTSWFVRTTAYQGRDDGAQRAHRLASAESVGEGRFGEWLKNNIDWAISRDRYWGTPLPVWVCDRDASHVEVHRSYADLSAALRRARSPPTSIRTSRTSTTTRGVRLGRCGGTMRRAPEVIDTWFDSGSMSFAQWHYPFENRDMIADQFPADFIAEGVDQTRGWFYSLLAIATGLGDALPNNAGRRAARTQ